MGDWISTVWRELVGRPSGPLAMRFYMQPATAAFFAVRDGLKDARARKPAFLWQCFTSPAERRDLIRHGWKSVGKVFVVAAILDVVYQLIVLHAIRPVQTLLIPTALAIVPYLLLRGPVNRIATARLNKSSRKVA